MIVFQLFEQFITRYQQIVSITSRLSTSHTLSSLYGHRTFGTIGDAVRSEYSSQKYQSFEGTEGIGLSTIEGGCICCIIYVNDAVARRGEP